MRFLHTSDWHVGKPLRNQKRDDEYVAALAEVLDIAGREAVDCVLVAGDIFDSVAPPPEAERIVFEFFRDLIGARIPAVIIAGNHDHPRRMHAFSRVLDLVDVHVRGEPVVAADGGIVEVRSRDGKETAVIAALPWVSERKVRDFESLFAGGEHFAEYAQGVAEMMKHLAKSFRPDAVNILLAHLFLSGAVVAPEGGERALHVGNVYAVNPQMIPATAQYAALGHVHKPQEFALANAYYSGSLLQCDFGEAGQQKGVNIIDAVPGGKAKVQAIPLTRVKQLQNIGSSKEGFTLDQIREAAPDAGDAYFKVFVKADRPVPGLAQEVRDILPNAVDIVVEHAIREGEEPPIEMGRQSPVELFTAYYADLHSGAEPPPELMSLFNRLHEEVTGAPH
ncbi:MAG TPA: exonuclease SbcCD subunit D C-terminal domain-containing protein [Dehalococcoidia bacterium]|nr:exonuclease SbcCD subunit D C-terminal domain-containing protein [Dehalococcoidia bacterium]